MMDIFLHLLVDDGHLSYIKQFPKQSLFPSPNLELWLASVSLGKHEKVKNEHEFTMKLP
jgi:hypothetical protein